MKIRLEGTLEEINKFLRGNNLTEQTKQKIKSVSKFYPNKTFFGDGQRDGRVYVEIN